MDDMDSVLRSINLQELIQSPSPPLISGLPEEIAFSILTRVPRKYHHTLRCVSKRWRDLVSSEEWYSHRQKNNLAETWVYAFCRDESEELSCYVLDPNSSQKSWKRMLKFPASFEMKGMVFEAIGRKLYFLGGTSCSWSQGISREVYSYDVSQQRCSDVAPLPSLRCYFACAVLDEKLYAIGGICNQYNSDTWDVYDPRTNTWDSHYDTTITHNREYSLGMNGRIYVRSSLDPQAFVYEPSSGVARGCIDDEMISGWKGPAVVVDNTLYVLDESSGTKLMMWNNNEWIPVRRLSALLTRPPCQLAAVGRRIVVVGRRLSTVIFDVGNARSMEGVMVGSSVPPLDYDIDVLACKCIAI